MNVTCVTEDAEEFTANAYLVTEPEPVLVDVGAMSGVSEVIAEHVDTLEAVYITHGHSDHVAQLDEVLGTYDPTVYAVDEIRPDVRSLDDGEVVEFGGEALEVVHTPGHADDHVAFVGERTVFTGDVVVYQDGAFDDGSFGRTDMAGQDREVLIESIERLLDRLPAGVESMYAGHGPAFHGDVREVIERALSRAERREPKYPE